MFSISAAGFLAAGKQRDKRDELAPFGPSVTLTTAHSDGVTGPPLQGNGRGAAPGHVL